MKRNFLIRLVLFLLLCYHADTFAYAANTTIGGAFTLQNVEGKTVTERDFAGTPMLVFMGYTQCPDVCPATLEILSKTLALLGGDADKITVLFISIDPHDTSETLHTYLGAFDHRIVGLRGDTPAIEKVVHAYKAFHVLDPKTDRIVHSELVYLMDKNGTFVTSFTAATPPQHIAEAIRALP